MPFRLEIVTAEGDVYSGDVDRLVAPGREGQLGILPGHAPLLTQLDSGIMEIHSEKENTTLAVSGGFLEVLGNKVVILADTAERADDIDIERAEAAMTRAQERLLSRESDIDLERALQTVARSRVRLNVARRRRRLVTGD